MPFEFHAGELPGLMVVERTVFPDERGTFAEVFKRSDFARAGIELPAVQDNMAFSKAGVLRGLHYQLSPAAQGKLVWAATGEIFDVAVDLRRGSPTEGEWQGVYLSEDNGRLFWIPPGFAHGYVVTGESAHVAYKVFGAEYSLAHDRGIRWDDPELAIEWPDEDPYVSERDRSNPSFAEAERNFAFDGDRP